MILNTTHNIGYKGNVKISIKSGKVVLAKKEIHNAGTVNLFKFLAECLKGEFNYSSVPCKIVLFKKSNLSNEDNYNDETTWKFTSDLAICEPIFVNSAAVSEVDTINNKASVKYVFRIPYSVLTDAEIYKLGLYANLPSSYEQDKYAYIGLIDTEDEKDWDPIVIENTGKKFALEIEWTLELTNN